MWKVIHGPPPKYPYDVPYEMRQARQSLLIIECIEVTQRERAA